MSHAVFDLAPEYLEKPHIPEEMQPSAVKEHGGQERKVIYQGETGTVMSGIFKGHNAEIIYKLPKEFLWKGSFKKEDDSAQ